jgi:hypothetical protein
MGDPFDGIGSVLSSCAGQVDLVVVVVLRGSAKVPTVSAMGTSP